jgi:hypothetical protein
MYRSSSASVMFTIWGALFMLDVSAERAQSLKIFLEFLEFPLAFVIKHSILSAMKDVQIKRVARTRMARTHEITVKPIGHNGRVRISDDRTKTFSINAPGKTCEEVAAAAMFPGKAK